MEKICLDSSVILEFLRGEQTTVEKVKYYADEEICITSLSLFEITSIIKKVEIVKQFINNVTVLPFNENCGHIASRIYDNLREKNVPVKMNSVLTAATCIDNGAFLFTKSRKDYEKIRGLKLV
ncbi:type II toxin-antitoxin system VapC family toxin [Candidatus Micrarchaeota archaeon]|nr:type II toxin-antitoxin system VapC family toxin [Candidatus Micrarchaeota archaeon]